MVGHPSSYFGDFLLAAWTDAVVRIPQADKLPLSSQIVDHFDIQTLLKIGLPLRIEGVGFVFYLDSEAFNGAFVQVIYIFPDS